MKNKILFLFTGFILTSIFIVIVNFIIDPFQIYSKAKYHKTIFMKGFYLNAGLIKNYNYDSVSIGSSMTQNFIINDLKKSLNFNTPIKLPISGGNIIEHYTILNSAVMTGKVKNVLFGIDIFSLKNDKNRLPEYLYDKNFLNDYKYLFSIDTLKRSILYPVLHKTIPSSHPRLDYNLMFQWQHNHKENDFSEEKLISEYLKNNINIDNNLNRDIVRERINNFEKYIIRIIKEYPDIKFTFFYPPYSILTFKRMDTKTLNNFLMTKQLLYEKLKDFKNVSLFDFQNNFTIISNLNNYKDLTHYHQKVNTLILKEIKQNKYKVYEENLLTNISTFKEQIDNYIVPNK